MTVAGAAAVSAQAGQEEGDSEAEEAEAESAYAFAQSHPPPHYPHLQSHQQRPHSHAPPPGHYWNGDHGSRVGLEQ